MRRLLARLGWLLLALVWAANAAVFVYGSALEVRCIVTGRCPATEFTP